MPSSFTYVLIPSDPDQPIEERTLPEPTELEENIGCLTRALNDYYKEAHRLDSAQSAQANESLKSTVMQKVTETNPGMQPDPKMLDMLANSQTCDIIQLLPSSQRSGWIGVNMYVDDKGVAKKLPKNARASAICEVCQQPTEVLGDAFLAKVWDDQDGFERKNIGLADLASDAAWIKEAQAVIAARPSVSETQQAMKSLQSATSSQSHEAQMPLSDRMAKATAARDEGTSFFKDGDISHAISKYTEAVQLLDPVPVEGFHEHAAAASDHLTACLLNLAACYLKNKQPYECIHSCDKALEMNDTLTKAWFRRGQACMLIEQFSVASKNLTRAAKLAPGSREIREALSENAKLLATKKEAPRIFSDPEPMTE